MTEEKLTDLVRLSNKIDNIKRDIDELNYIKDKDYIFLSAKDGRVTYEKYAYCRIPRSLTHLICNEVEYKLKMELASLEYKFEQEGVQPIKHGRWVTVRVDGDSETICNNCYENTIMRTDFCPHCGADMRGDENA